MACGDGRDHTTMEAGEGGILDSGNGVGMRGNMEIIECDLICCDKRVSVLLCENPLGNNLVLVPVRLTKRKYLISFFEIPHFLLLRY